MPTPSERVRRAYSSQCIDCGEVTPGHLRCEPCLRLKLADAPPASVVFGDTGMQPTPVLPAPIAHERWREDPVPQAPTLFPFVLLMAGVAVGGWLAAHLIALAAWHFGRSY